MQKKVHKFVPLLLTNYIFVSEIAGKNKQENV